jgi:hypothetical protein
MLQLSREAQCDKGVYAFIAFSDGMKGIPVTGRGGP